MTARDPADQAPAEDQALIAVGAELLSLLDEPKTVSRLWDELRRARAEASPSPAAASEHAIRPRQRQETRCNIPFDWFILALDLLYLLGTVELERGRIRRVAA